MATSYVHTTYIFFPRPFLTGLSEHSGGLFSHLSTTESLEADGPQFSTIYAQAMCWTSLSLSSSIWGISSLHSIGGVHPSWATYLYTHAANLWPTWVYIQVCVAWIPLFNSFFKLFFYLSIVGICGLWSPVLNLCGANEDLGSLSRSFCSRSLVAADKLGGPHPWGRAPPHLQETKPAHSVLTERVIYTNKAWACQLFLIVLVHLLCS